MVGDIPDEIYRRELLRLQTDMVKMTERVRVEGLRIVVFEGRDAAGKGGVIKRITEYVSPPRVASAGPAELHASPSEQHPVDVPTAAADQAGQAPSHQRVIAHR